MAHTTIASLPRSPRRRLTHRPATPRGAMLRLSALAGAIERIAREGRPAAWDADPADDDVVAVLTHLGPIRSRAALASSYAREGRRLVATADRTPGAREVVDAIDVAYAIRWLELAEVTALGRP